MRDAEHGLDSGESLAVLHLDPGEAFAELAQSVGQGLDVGAYPYEEGTQQGAYESNHCGEHPFHNQHYTSDSL